MNEQNNLNNLLAALELAPDNVPLLNLIASEYSKIGRPEKAQYYLEKLLQLNPESLNVKFDLARVFYAQEKHDASMIILEEILNQEPLFWQAHLLMAKVLHASNEHQQAYESYQKAVSIEPGKQDQQLENSLLKALGVNDPGDDFNKASVTYEDDDYLIEPEKPKINFAEVGGMAQVKKEISIKIIAPIKFPDLYKAYDKKIGGGILLYGPPGCGKTHLVKATAGEVNANFISVGINDILDMWIGNSEKNLHNIFEQARGLSPSVLFFDEVDALGANRSDMKKSGARHLINQFLAELDGDKYDNDGVLILAATNSPWNMDPAFRRPGRFDRIIFVPPPDEEARASIIEILLKNKPVLSINHKKIAAKTKNFSGADLKGIIDLAIENKLELSMEKGEIIPVETRDILKAAAARKSSVKEWFNTARNYALYANDGGLYDDILKYLNMDL